MIPDFCDGCLYLFVFQHIAFNGKTTRSQAFDDFPGFLKFFLPSGYDGQIRALSRQGFGELNAQPRGCAGHQGYLAFQIKQFHGNGSSSGQVVAGLEISTAKKGGNTRSLGCAAL
jgi:hypothetical protein